MDRLTLSQAQERVAVICNRAGIDAAAIDWNHPREEARLAWVRFIREESPPHREIAWVLERYQAHIDFQDGRAFELAAVKAALAEHVRGAKPAEFPALVAFGLVINSGLHHAEPEPVTPQARDIWLGGRMLTQIRCVVGENLDSVVVSDLYGDRAHRVETIADFTRNRRLVERDGKAVI